MHIKVLNKKGVLLDRETKKVILPSLSGEMEVLPGHAATVVVLKAGEIKVEDDKVVFIRGVAKIENEEILVLLGEERRHGSR